jgi:hypothetical protein
MILIIFQGVYRWQNATKVSKGFSVKCRQSFSQQIIDSEFIGRLFDELVLCAYDLTPL